MALGQDSAGRDLRARLLYLGCVLLAGLLVLVINLYRLQVVHGDDFLARSEENRVMEVRSRASRGKIFDRRREVLADERPSQDLVVRPALCQRCVAEVVPRLAKLLAWDDAQRERVQAQIKAAHGPQAYQDIPVVVDLTRGQKWSDELDVVNAHLSELPGFQVNKVPHRQYHTQSPEGVARLGLAHVLGYMNEVTAEELEVKGRHSEAAREDKRARYLLGDFIGRRGVERAFELRECAPVPNASQAAKPLRCGLKGTDGYRMEVVNARGQTMLDNGLPRVVAEAEAEPGDNLILSIDARLQAEAEAVFPGRAGAVAVADVNTGFIRAMLSRPAFDPNAMTGRISTDALSRLKDDSEKLRPMVFRPAAEHYSPGSVFKPVTLLAALRSGAFNEHTQVNCSGSYRLGARPWRCHKESGHGLRTARSAIVASCDTYFYRVADVLGLDAIAAVGKEFGLGRPTGIDVVAEVPGIMPDSAYHERATPGGYTKGMALNSAIGQGDVNVTPLQVLMMYAAIANGGTVYAPQLVLQVESSAGEVLQMFPPRVVGRVKMTPKERALLVDALVAVVNEPSGTGYRSRLKGITVAGKTGTAQVSRLGTTRLKKDQMDYFARDHAWFVAFAPAEAPEIVVVVLNEHGGHGASDAAPAATALIQKYFDLKKSDGAAAPDPRGR